MLYLWRYNGLRKQYVCSGLLTLRLSLFFTATNIRLDVGQCITFCAPVTGCPFPPPVVTPPPICNGTAWISGTVNNTGVTTVNSSAPLEIISDYTQDSSATLEVIVDGSGTVPLVVNGTNNQYYEL